MMEEKAMTNSHFRMMSFLFKIRDIFNNPKKFLESHIPLAKGSIVLDYGCGPGSFTIPLAEIVGNTGVVYAADIHPMAIEQVQRKANQKNLNNIRPILMDGYDTGITDGSVNAIIFFDTYHHIQDKQALFDEFKRILSDGGKIYMDQGHLARKKALEFLNKLENFTVQPDVGNKIILEKK